MITSVRLINFKNFADETLKLGPFTVIVGANASGKSNIRDAFRFLHGIGRGYSLAEIIGGKYGVGGQLEWEPIRGAPNAIARIHGMRSTSSFGVQVESKSGTEQRTFSTKIGVNQDKPDKFQMLEEKLIAGGCLGYESNPDFESTFWVNFGSEHAPLGIYRSQPALSQLANGHFNYHPIPGLGIFVDLGRMRFFDFKPDLMKLPSVVGTTLSDHGENLPSVLHSICADKQSEAILASWIRGLTPMDVKGFRFSQTLSGRIEFEIVEQTGRRISADAVSDGTIRFLGLLTAMLDAEVDSVYFFEEIDTGLHPARLSLLVDLIERQTTKRRFQVVTTTHSPELLSVISDETFDKMSVVYRDEDSDDGIIRCVSELHNVRDLRDSQGLARLHSTGWMENVLGFEHDPEEETAPVT